MTAMNISISVEDKIVLEEFKDELIQIKEEVKELSIMMLIQLRSSLFQFLLSYKEYSLTNIREYGLGEILMSRASRFFKLDQGDESQKNPKEKKKIRIWKKLKNNVFNSQSESKKSFESVVGSNINRGVKGNLKTKRGGKYILKKSLKIVLFPFYLVVLLFGMLLGSGSTEKVSGSGKNTYKPY